MAIGSQETERITRIEAAQRQLVTAIELFFEGRDAISVHTLAAAAHGILRDLLKLRSGASIIKDNPLVRPDRQKEFIAILNTAQNFFKHADRDPGKAIEFRPDFTQFLLIDAIFMYEGLTGRKLQEGTVFATWMAVKYPNTISNADLELAELVNELRSKADNELNRHDFLRLLNTGDPKTRSDGDHVRE
jgi:hypothetical protein